MTTFNFGVVGISPSRARQRLQQLALIRGRVVSEPQRAGGEGERLRRFPSPMTRQGSHRPSHEIVLSAVEASTAWEGKLVGVSFQN